MIFEGEGSGGAGGGKPKFIDDFFPEFVVRDRLPSSLFTDCFVEFIEVELLSSNLRYFDIADALGGPVLVQMLLKFVLLF
jgi:hypothetical protein